MAPIIPNYTGRYNVYYSAAGEQHRMTFRYDRGVEYPSDELINGVADFLAALQPGLTNTFALRGAGYVRADTNIELPYRMPPLSGQGEVAIGHKGVVPSFVGFVGKTSAGRRLKVSVFGWVPNSFNEVDYGRYSDYRLYAHEDMRINNALAALSMIPLVGIDNYGQVFWRSYANVGFSGYWQRKVRG